MICTKCKTEKSPDSFRTRKQRGKSILVTHCKECESNARADHHRKRMLDPVYAEAYRIKNAEASNRCYHNGGAHRTKEQRRKTHKTWVAANREKVREWRRLYSRKIRSTITGRLSIRMGNRMRMTLTKHRRSWKDAVPYTAEELKRHLEQQFTQEMSWENYGKYWHVDHIRPVCTFHYTSINDAEFKECWALSNLRPLPKTKNLSRPKDGRDIATN